MIKRVLLGVAVGDAFGTGIEGQDKDWIHKNVDFTKYVSARTSKYSQGYKLGDYSDDTSDTLAMFKLLKNLKDINSEKLLEEIRAEYEKSKQERGGIPRAGYGSISWYFEGNKTMDEIQDFQRKKVYPGNAPVMRSIPIGMLVPDNKIHSVCILNADLTHPHPKARIASILIARAAQHLLILKLPASELISKCSHFVLGMDSEFDQYLEKVDRLGSELASFDDYCLLVGPQPIKSFMTGQMIIGLNSDAMRTAGAALYLLKFCKTPLEALTKSIQIGGDVDTLASIVLGIVCGTCSDSDLPGWLFDQLEHVQELTDFADHY